MIDSGTTEQVLPKFTDPGNNYSDLKAIFGNFAVMTTVPTHTPSSLADTIVLYTDSLTAPTINRIYFYNYKTATWIAVTGGSATGFSQKARAYRATSNQTIPTGVWTKVQLNAESYDEDGSFDSTTNYRFTNSTGSTIYVAASATVYYTNVDAGVPLGVQIQDLTGTTRAVALQFGGTVAGDASVTVSDIIKLTNGEGLHMYTLQQAGTDKDILAATHQTYMAIHRLS